MLTALWLRVNIWVSDWNHPCGLVFFETKYNIFEGMLSVKTQFPFFFCTGTDHREESPDDSSSGNIYPCQAIFRLEGWWPSCHSGLLLSQGKEVKGKHWSSWASGPDRRPHLLPTISRKWGRHDLSHQTSYCSGKYKLST